MDFRKMEAFLTIANTGKFTAAAEKLFISQSSLSKQMAQIERELGVKLFKKTRNGVELTQAGFDFYSYAHRAVPEYQQAAARLRMFREGSTVPLRFGALPLIDEYGFAESFSSYWVRRPSVQIEQIERNQETLIDKLQRHKIDLALLRVDMIDADQFSHIPVLTDELVIACSVRDPLASLSSVRVSDLRNKQFILLEEQSDVTRIFRRACESAGFCPNAPLHHSRHRMLIKAVQNDMGVTVLPRKLVTAYLAPDLAIVPLAQPLPSTLGFAWLAGSTPSEVVREFVRFVCADFHVDVDEDSFG